MTTRDVGDAGVVVECDVPAFIPLHRLVYLQVEQSAQATAGLPACLRGERVLSVVWGVDACRRATGTPSGYSLRFLNEPRTVPMTPSAEGAHLVAAAS